VTCAEDVEGPPTALPTSMDITTKKSQQKTQEHKATREKKMGMGAPKSRSLQVQVAADSLTVGSTFGPGSFKRGGSARWRGVVSNPE
jgi:hypothetical protein